MLQSANHVPANEKLPAGTGTIDDAEHQCFVAWQTARRHWDACGNILSWGWGALKQPARAGTIDSPNFVVSIVVFILPVLGYSWVIKRADARGAVATAEGPHGEDRFAGDSGAR